MNNNDISINKQDIVLNNVIQALEEKAQEHSQHTQEDFEQFLKANRVSIIERITKNLTQQELVDVCFKRAVLNETIRNNNTHNANVYKNYYNSVSNPGYRKTTRKTVINRIIAKDLLKEKAEELEAIA